jgi:hypothetical protein
VIKVDRLDNMVIVRCASKLTAKEMKKHIAEFLVSLADPEDKVDTTAIGFLGDTDD